MKKNFFTNRNPEKWFTALHLVHQLAFWAINEHDEQIQQLKR